MDAKIPCPQCGDVNCTGFHIETKSNAPSAATPSDRHHDVATSILCRCVTVTKDAGICLDLAQATRLITEHIAELEHELSHAVAWIDRFGNEHDFCTHDAHPWKLCSNCNCHLKNRRV